MCMYAQYIEQHVCVLLESIECAPSGKTTKCIGLAHLCKGEGPFSLLVAWCYIIALCGFTPPPNTGRVGNVEG